MLYFAGLVSCGLGFGWFVGITVVDRMLLCVDFVILVGVGLCVWVQVCRILAGVTCSGFVVFGYGWCVVYVCRLCFVLFVV